MPQTLQYMTGLAIKQPFVPPVPSAGHGLHGDQGAREKVASRLCEGSVWLVVAPPSCSVLLLPSPSLSSLHTCRAEADCLWGV